MATRTKKIDITPDKTLFPKIGQTGYTAGQALSELIDNSIDVINPKLGKVSINIKIDKKKGVIIVEDDGLGMSEDVAANSIKIGSSRKREGELGQFGIGLKASCMSLGGKFTLETSPQDSDEEYILVFDEEDFLSKGNWNDFEITIKNGADKGKSFTRIKIEKFKIKFYPTFPEVLKKHLSERFSPFIANKEVEIKLNGEKIRAESADIFPDSRKEFSITLSSGDVIKGWTGILKVGSVEKSGFNLYRNKRLIRVHEKLGYVYHPSKMAITGEIHMNTLPVTINKREFETENEYYIEFFQKFSEYLKPILAEVQQRHQEEKIKDLPREIKETLKDNLLKALNNSDELKELAFPGADTKKRSEEGELFDKEERESPENEVGTIEKDPEADGGRTPKKTSENKARFITIAGRRFRFDYEWGSLEESIAKEAYLDKEKNTIMVILNQNYNILKVLPKADIFYHVIFLAEGIVEVFLRENKQSLEKATAIRDSLVHKLADVMSEDSLEESATKDSQILSAQTYLLKASPEDMALNENEVLVLERRLENGQTYQEIATEMHLSRQRIEQLFKSALNKISGIRKRIPTAAKTAERLDTVVEKAVKEKAEKDAIQSVINNTASMYGVDVDDLLGSRRQSNFILPRHTIMYLLRKELGLSFPMIGKIMGKDHTTIIYAYHKIESFIEGKA
ncbi:MAG: helix-turn-helix domain-containing protein [Candidatus Paceibacterota bacterium]